jgi:hypothetical protein
MGHSLSGFATGQALRALAGQSLPTIPSRDLLEEAFRIAVTFDRSFL